ncbi:MAG TPA: hypothetical protein VHZ76_00260 [Gammaproteobacteria bacterium]|jgi:hypothetical protein|nr:hypothetical protein [Gammaproteobacteria bacterium]
MFNNTFKETLYQCMTHLFYIFLYSAGPMVIFLVTMFKIEEAACPKKPNVEVVKMHSSVKSKLN